MSSTDTLKIMNSDGIVHITDKEQYRRYLEKYRCSNLKELIETLWFTYGVDLEISKKLEDSIIFSETYGNNSKNGSIFETEK